MFILSFTDGANLSMPGSIFVDRAWLSDKTSTHSSDFVDRKSICNNALYANTIFIYLS